MRNGPNVYVVTFEDEVLALDWKTGELVWKFQAGPTNEEFFMSSTPVVSEDRVFIGGLDGIVYALDGNSGEVLWKRDLGGRVSTSMLLGGGSLYVGTSTHHLYRLEPKSGTVIGDRKVEDQPEGQLLFADDSLFVFFGDATSSSGQHRLACFDGPLKAIRWIGTAAGPWSSSRPYARDNAVLVGNRSGEVFGFRRTDGTRLWSEKFDGVIRGIGSAEDVLYIGTLQGRLYAWRSKP